MGKLTLYVTPEFEPVWAAFKKICDREDESRSSKVAGMVARYVAVHSEGNPQLLLKTFIGETKLICWHCRGKFPSLIHVKFASGITRKICRTCKEIYDQRGLVKRVLV